MLDFSKIRKKNCWSKEKALKWQKEHPYTIGVNYIPQTAINSTEMWEEESFDIKTIDKELHWAHNYGYNGIRVFLPYIVYEREGENFLKTIEKFLQICDIHKIKVTFVLFDDCAFSNLLPYYGKQREPIKLVHNSGWTASPGEIMVNDRNCYGKLKEYLQTVMGRFKDDERVLMWDLYNECGNNKSGKKSEHLLKSAFLWAREVNPSQPITACVWAVVNGDAVEGCYDLDTICFEQSDVITYHYYGNIDLMKSFVKNINASGYPLFCTEWLARVFFDCRVDTILPYFSQNNISSYHWGFVNGKTQTNIPWNWDSAKGEPDVWFHDVVHRDGTPYNEEEMRIIKAISQKNCAKK